MFTMPQQQPMHVTGAVHSRVVTLNRRLLGASSGDSRMNMDCSLPPRVRHGAAEKGARPRRRSRGRDEGSVRPVTGRTQPVGPQEEDEWM